MVDILHIISYPPRYRRLLVSGKSKYNLKKGERETLLIHCASAKAGMDKKEVYIGRKLSARLPIWHNFVVGGENQIMLCQKTTQTNLSYHLSHVEFSGRKAIINK